MADERRPHLLVFAYACAPDQGSEYGAGWGVVTALREFARLTVLTGSRDIGSIRDWGKANQDPDLEFVEISDRRLGRFMRWHRIPEFLLYLLWLRKAKKAAFARMAATDLNGVVHATYSAFWLPTPATNLGIPSVWGPVGGGVTTPRPLWRLLGTAGVFQELLDLVSVRVMAWLPATRRSASRATRRLLQNRESLELLPSRAQVDCRILNHALFSVVPQSDPEPDGGYALWVSPMESRKGPRLVVEALARTRSDITLMMVGDGPQRKPLEELAGRLGIADRITFTGWVERHEAVKLMRGARTVVFTGLREEGGLALAEAMYAARRVIVLDHGGAGAIARAATDQERVTLVPEGDLDAVASGFAAAIDAHHAALPVEDQPLLDRGAAVTELRDAVFEALEQDHN
ncbi:MAG: glycosyltransferase [Acidimicrobiia bacterium]|nr:glycosyltransferase [Acidimicrobiia bacterium]